jgi:hypothetical protein
LRAVFGAIHNVLGCNETFTRAGPADMYFVSRAKSFRVVQAGTTAALNFRFTRHKASKHRHTAKATPLMDAASAVNKTT